MADDTDPALGTDTVIGSAATSTSIEEDLIMADSKTRTRKSATPKAESATGKTLGTQLADTVRSRTDGLSVKAADGARDLIGQGLERTSSAIGNISRLVGDSAASLDTQLGEDVGDYARRASETLKSTADRIGAKSADELIDDTRDFVRKSPGVALAGAAVIGFALARLVKSGLDRDDDDA